MKTGAATVALASAALFTLPAAASADDGSVAEAAVLGLVGGLINAKLEASGSPITVQAQYRGNRGGRGGYNDYRSNHASLGSRPYNMAMRACSAKAFQRVLNQGHWSAQLVGHQNVQRVDNRLWKLNSRMRVIGPNGERFRQIECLVSRGDVVRFGPAGNGRNGYRGW